jgi:hypothetical protein
MGVRSNWARSSGWFNKLVNEDVGNPPPPATLEGLAQLLRVSRRRVAELVAEQWYGVRPDDEIPPHLRALLEALQGVAEEDLPYIEQLVDHFKGKHAARLTLEAKIKKAFEEDLAVAKSD